MSKLVLAADVGGTNARLIAQSISAGETSIVAEKSYRSADYEDMQSIVEIFLAKNNISQPIDSACFAIAGPVKQGVARVTNLPWTITLHEMQVLLKTQKVMLINDLAAAAFGVSQLKENEILTLQAGEKNDSQNRNNDAVVIGVGTGLGAAHLVSRDGLLQVFSSEAGHAGFSPVNDLQQRLLAKLLSKSDHVSVENLLSGRGLVAIYNFLRDESGYTQSDHVSAEMKIKDTAQVITEHALQADDGLCVDTLALFVDIYGAAAGDIVLHYYPVNTLYLVGGVAAKIKPALSDGRFLKAMHVKGPMSDNMKKLTVKLVTQEKVGLLGALFSARRLLKV